MSKVNYFLAIILCLDLFELIQNQGAPFCFPLCGGTSQCADITYAGCSGAACRMGTGFRKPGGAPAKYFCQKVPYNYYSNTDQKWQPSGLSPDIPIAFSTSYGGNVNLTVQTLTVSPDTQGACVDGGVTYTHYALTGPDVFTITHPGISSLINFWQVRLIYEVITFDKWDTIYQIKTQFNSNLTAGVKTNNVTNAGEQQLCGASDKQRYNFIQYDYDYFDKAGFEWNISTTSTDSTMKWGILNIIVSVRLCHPWCLACFGDGPVNSCTACNYPLEATKLSYLTCAKNCIAGYGDNSSNYAICIKCTDLNCRYCMDSPTNCLGCNNSYFLYENSPGVIICVTTCPSHYYGNTTGNDTCFQCNANCLECTGDSTTCSSCYPTFYLYQSICYNPCPYETYSNAPTQSCLPCDNYCSVCAFSPTNCTVCDVTGQYKSYLKDGTSCVVQCGFGYFPNDNYGMGPNVCEGCEIRCKTCDITPYNCFTCNAGYYFLNNTCNNECPYPEYFKDDITWTCLDCETFCVNMTMTVRWQNSLKDEIICDMEFTQALNWGPTQIAAFIKVTTNDTIIDLNSFNFIYEAVTPKIMRLRLSPKGYTFIYNVTFKFKTITYDPANHHYAANGYRFRDTNYDVEQEIMWFLIKAPSLSDTEKTVMDSFANISDRISTFTTLPYVQEIKKAGIFSLLMGGAQATSTAVLVNTIPSQNFYEGVRFWASFVFFDVPPWEQSSKKSKYLVVPNIDKLIENARLMQEEIVYQNHQIRSLFDTDTIGWRFQRTGYTSFFIFDTYMNIAMILVCWVLLTVAHYLIKHKVHQSRLLSMFYSFTLKVHEITIFYISLTTLLEWTYFQPISLQRWISLGLCILFNVYFLAYELYIYYDMINYPHAQIGNKRYDYYVIRYGSLLKNIRFVQYDPYQEWSMRQWFRPYNYHIMSYYKKFLMMIALPIFYSTKQAQISMLIIIQAMEMVRFLVIWPFTSKVRNYIRLGLQFCLLLFFASVLIQALKLPEIMSGDQILIAPAVEIYYGVGWIGFAMVFIFNIGHIAIWVYDCVLGCRKSNREMMDRARKLFYMSKLKQFEEENTDVPLALVNKWVKLGNLNDRKYDLLPDLNLRVEYFRIVKNHVGFEIDMKKLFEVFMNIEFNYQKENNIAAGKKLNKRFTLTRSLSPNFYFMIENLYNQYAATVDFEYLTLKTFQKVIQSEYQAGSRIPLDPLKMMQKIELETAAGQKKTIKLHNLLPGFPLSYEDLKQFA